MIVKSMQIIFNVGAKLEHSTVRANTEFFGQIVIRVMTDHPNSYIETQHRNEDGRSCVTPEKLSNYLIC